MKLSKIALACLVATGISAPTFVAANDSFEFNGYARMGVNVAEDSFVGAAGQTGNAAGRLGNESFGGEWEFKQNFLADSGAQWEVALMLEDWGNLGVKQSYAGVSNVFESQPNMYVWGGKVFHGRMQQGLNDYYVSIQDGSGAGFKGMDLGALGNLELGFVDGSGGSGGDGKSGNYVATSKLGGIGLGDAISMDLVFNYGFAGSSVADADSIDAYQAIAKISGWNQNFYARYADNVADSLAWGKIDGQSSVYLSLEGGYSFSERMGMDYLVGYHDISAADADVNGDSTNYNVIVRPTYSWNDTHSTWLEAGYSVVEFDDIDAENTAYKLTLSQNMAIGPQTWARPMLRFYATVGKVENEATPAASEDNSDDRLILGAMFEAWW